MKVMTVASQLEGNFFLIPSSQQLGSKQIGLIAQSCETSRGS